MSRKAVSYLLYILSAVFTCLLLIASVLSWRASFLSPEHGQFWASVALMMPVILVLNLFMLVWWMLKGKWGLMLLPVAALALNMGYIASMIQLPDFRDGSERHDVRIMTLNANGFRRLEHVAVSARAMARLAEKEAIDILCLQEFTDEPQYTADSIAALFARRMPYFVREGGEAIVSRFPIVDSDYVKFPETNNDYMWADLRIGTDTVRVFSVHLQTSGISSLRHRFRKDYNRNAPVGEVVGALESNSIIRARQVDEIRRAIDATPYPVLLAGDFNDTPSSYTYRRMKGRMTDGFRAAGNGYGGTFRYLGGMLRIDYIFYDDHFAGTRYYSLREDVSDHKAVVAEVRFRR